MWYMNPGKSGILLRQEIAKMMVMVFACGDGILHTTGWVITGPGTKNTGTPLKLLLIGYNGNLIPIQFSPGNAKMCFTPKANVVIMNFMLHTTFCMVLNYL